MNVWESSGNEMINPSGYCEKCGRALIAGYNKIKFSVVTGEVLEYEYYAECPHFHDDEGHIRISYRSKKNDEVFTLKQCMQYKNTAKFEYSKARDIIIKPMRNQYTRTSYTINYPWDNGSENPYSTQPQFKIET